MLLIYLAAAWVVGMVCATLIRLPTALWVWLLLLPVGLIFIWRRDPILRRVHFCLLAFLLGALRYTAALPGTDASSERLSLAAFNDRGAVALIGDVIEPPEVRDRTANVRVSITRVRTDRWRDVSGLALVQMPRETDVRYGDQLQIFGEPATPSEYEDFSYKDYLARQGIHSLIRIFGGTVTVLARDQGNPFFSALYAFKARALATIYAIFPEPAASLLAGILLGVDSGIPRDLGDAFSATNTAHIIAISGFNVSIIAGVLSKLAQRVVARHATLLVIAGLVIYTLFVGAGASVVRAAIMGALSVLALHYGRQNDALNALALAALLMTALNPFTLFDLSFQLSFLATLGLILYVTPLTTWFETKIAQITSTERAKQIVGALSDSFIVTLAAQITTTPLIVFAFHRFSLVGLLTNFFVLPVQPPLMIWGGLATLIGMIAQPIGQVIAWIAWAFLEWTIVVVQATASLPFSSIQVGRFDMLLLGLYYLLLFGATRLGRGGVTPPLRSMISPALGLGIALVAGVWLWNLGLTAPDDRTHVEFLDAGSAATFIRTPRGSKILIDGGANPSVVLSTLGQRIPFWDRSLDLLVLTRADDEHLAGLVAALERYDVRQIIQVSAPAKPSVAYLKWRDLVAQKRPAILPGQSDLQVVLDRDVTLEMLYPTEDAQDARAAIARLRVSHFAFLFADGVQPEEQTAWLATGADPASAALIAPRKISPEFFDEVNPQYAIVFVGHGAREKPSNDLLGVLSRATILRTDERGSIEFILDGQMVAVRTTR